MVNKHKIIQVIGAYFIIGAVYSIGTYLNLIITGKEIVFHPIVGVPLTALYWPRMFYASINYRGISYPEISLLLVILFFIIYFIKTWAVDS